MRLAEERERAVQDAREGVPADQREPFELALERAQRGAMLNEDHNYWIDQQMMHWLRQTLIEIGRRLVDRGAIEAPNDVAMLYLDEVRAALTATDDDRVPLVDERRAEMNAWSQLNAPPMLGRPTPAPAEQERMFGLGAELR